ncbi:hypothetical protein HJC23_004698 [Cyclotella cryptica]|uniref:Ankyrin n=1 Tax=Cyclotella cryptica TaxID=29204 RepID=A0ABD3PS50_9STRA
MGPLFFSGPRPAGLEGKSVPLIIHFKIHLTNLPSTTEGMSTESTTKSDIYARLHSGSTAGRGSIAGWTPCPLCFAGGFDKSTLLSSIIPSDETIINILSNLKSSKSTKLFSHGRGLAAHLHAVHTPWNPGKAELKRREALRKRYENEQMRIRKFVNVELDDDSRTNRFEDGKRPIKRAKLIQDTDCECERGNTAISTSIPVKWDPSSEELSQWNQRVLEIVNLVELESKKPITMSIHEGGENASSEVVPLSNLQEDDFSNAQRGTDRSGKPCPSYRESLPPFLAAAADGNIAALRQCIRKHDAKTNDVSQCNADATTRRHIQSLIYCRDRNGSTAEHWAAGGGHTDCLSYLLELRDMVTDSSSSQTMNVTTNDAVDKTVSDASLSSTTETNHDNKKIRKRRDGKTPLHYAARNGHTACIDCILSRPDAPSVNIPSGDGTTPLHMACYGGHPSTVRHLINVYHANVHATNEWMCGVAHWSAMSLGNEGMDAVIDLCNYLKGECDVDFVARQRQGHTPLHKAASKKNQKVIEWLAGKSMDGKESVPRFSDVEMKLMGEPDKGGNVPSDIWSSVGGDVSFASWMKNACGW